MNFRNILVWSIALFLLSTTIKAQPLTGTKTIDNAGGGDYPTFIAAITALNTGGVGSGGVTFVVTDGQTFTSAPLTITATGTAGSPVVFKQSGAGLKPILIFTGSSGIQAGFKLDKCDYITFNGFDLRDAGTAMEYGFQLLGGDSDGCQYNTIENCSIDLDKVGSNDNGFYISSSAKSFEGTNSYNKFYNNVVKDCFKGYYFYGNTDVNADIGNEINAISGGVSKIESISSIGLHFYSQKNFLIKNTLFTDISGTGTLYGIHIQGGTHNTVTIANCSFNNISSSGGDAVALRLGSSDTLNIYNNIFSNISYTGTSSGSAFGIYASAMTLNMYNNMIGGISAPASTDGTLGACGIYLSSGITVNMFHNTVLLNYTSTVASNKSAALYIPPNNHTSILFSNNIFCNNVNVTTGSLAVAFMKGTSGKYINNLSTTSDNNIYYAGTPGTKNLILYDGTNSCQTIEEYKSYVSSRPLDQNSITENVPFASSSIPYDLHINPSVMTLLESAGIPITSPFVISSDLDGDLRNATTPDIGADEGNFLLNDINPPTISYALLSNTEITSNRNISNVIITDYSGINVLPGTRPRLYYKRLKDSNIYISNTNATNGWKWVETNGTVSSFEFTIDYSKLYNGGVSAGDIIQYFVSAQDNNSTPNVGINSGTFNSPPVSVALSSAAFPVIGIINSYSISFAGTCFVGTGHKYISLTKTDGLFEAISSGSLSGNTQAIVTSDLTEDGATALTQWKESGSGNYTLTISPSGSAIHTVSGSSTSGLIKISGCSRAIFDGSYNGTGEYLTFRNTDIVSPVFLIADNSKNNILQNLIIESSATNIDNAAVKLGFGTNLENIIQNCIIRDITDATLVYRRGIYVNGGGNRDTKILNNKIYNFGTAAIVLSGGCKNTLIEGNSIYHTQTSGIIYVYGIHLNNSSLTKVFRNRIFDLDATESVHGIYYEGTNGVISAQIINNMITLSPTTATTVTGIVYSGNVGNSLTVYHNSVYLGGSLTSGPYNSYAFAKLKDVEVLNVKNNIFVNGRTNNGGTGNHYAVYFATMQGADYFNYNNYYSVTQNGFYGWFANPITDLDTWRQKSLFDLDANSIARNPNFISTSDLHLNTTLPPYFLAGTPLNITTDFDGDLRHATFPYIGCDENAFLVLPIETNPQKGIGFSLEQNYPNPFIKTTTITWQLPNDAHVVLKVYDFTGREVKTLVDCEQAKGEHKATFDATGLPAGVYSYRLSVNGIIEIKKMIYLK